ncbi:spore coat protein [Clostridium bovifaecis]|uniref:Spore coat protein n=1 Tax=Clostridium bovifaecis TaxID=2184719 RepID=A0A6I6EUM4_9CLOT|nr:spore coat protein [Clostridium bovifaecis]
MNSIIESLTGMDKMSDQVIATDFLIAAKSGIKNYAVALTETTSPEVRVVLRRHLNDAIRTHEVITNYMMKNGYYHAYNPQEQFEIDMKITKTALNLTT